MTPLHILMFSLAHPLLTLTLNVRVRSPQVTNVIAGGEPAPTGYGMVGRKNPQNYNSGFDTGKAWNILSRTYTYHTQALAVHGSRAHLMTTVGLLWTST